MNRGRVTTVELQPQTSGGRVLLLFFILVIVFDVFPQFLQLGTDKVSCISYCLYNALTTQTELNSSMLTGRNKLAKLTVAQFRPLLTRSE